MDQLLADPTHEWTVDGLNALELDDRFRYEIFDGALLVSPAPAYNHEIAGEQLRQMLRTRLPDGVLVVGPSQLRLGRSAPIPDLVVADIAAVRDRQNLLSHEVYLAVEIVSPSSVSADRILKPALYAAAGVAHYWRVETDPLLLTVYALDGETYREVGTWRAGDIARLDTPFAVEIDVAQLLPDA